MQTLFAGIYWTLPVNWAGFRDLPPAVDDAAAASRTIRYQRDRVRDWVQKNDGLLLAEIAFMDVRPDRATDAVHDVLQRHAHVFAGRRPTLLAVRFEDAHHWRRNPFLYEAAGRLGLQVMPLSPEAMDLDGERFDPARHFAAWRKQDGSALARLRLQAHEGLRTALAELPGGDGRWQAAADRLNRTGVRTIRGGTWTPENVRKLAGRLQLTGTPEAG